MKRLQILLPFVGVAVLLAVWSLTVWARVVDPVLLPSPISTFKAMWLGMTSGKLGVDFIKTVERTVYSTAIAAVIAIPLGILLGSSEKLYRSVEFLIDFFRSTPASAMFPLFLVLFGVGDRTKIDKIAGMEARGFIFGAPVATALGIGFVPVRKPGKLPFQITRRSYALEYGTDTLEMHEDAVKKGQRVLIVDDLLATGGTARATVNLVKKVGGDVHALAFLIELVGLNGRAKLAGEQVHATLQY